MPKILLIGPEEDCEVADDIFSEEAKDVFLLKAHNGKEGIDLFKQNQNQIDLVMLLSLFLGIRSCGMPVDQIMQEIKNLNPGIKLIITSGHKLDRDYFQGSPDWGKIDRVLQIGFDAFIPKPFNPPQFILVVKEVLAKT